MVGDDAPGGYRDFGLEGQGMDDGAAPNFADFYDAELALHNAHFRVAAAVGPPDRVLDIGCGAGQTTRDAARAAGSGRAHGVDLSVTMLEIARRRSAEEGLSNATFEVADAQSHGFAATEYDLCISRFGIMFFDDPTVAFANIAGAIRPGGRIVFMVWQGRDRNEWATAIQEAIDGDSKGPVAAGKAFSLSDPLVTAGLLEAAGFSGIAFRDINEPVFYGPDPETALSIIKTFETVAKALDRPAATEIRSRLLGMLGAHRTPRGVQFDSRAWLITGRR